MYRVGSLCVISDPSGKNKWLYSGHRNNKGTEMLECVFAFTSIYDAIEASRTDNEGYQSDWGIIKDEIVLLTGQPINEAYSILAWKFTFNSEPNVIQGESSFDLRYAPVLSGEKLVYTPVCYLTQVNL